MEQACFKFEYLDHNVMVERPRDSREELRQNVQERDQLVKAN